MASKGNVLVRCEVCNNRTFISESKKRKYVGDVCSSSCNRILIKRKRGDKVRKSCPECHRLFVPRISSKGKSEQVYCSSTCSSRKLASDRSAATVIAHPLLEARKCLRCDAEFIPNTERHKYCTWDCSHRHHAEGKADEYTFVCQECGENFTSKDSAERKYCSRKCVGKALSKARAKKLGNRKDTRTCLTCNNTFEAFASSFQKYCSRECVPNRGRPRKIATKKCDHCNKDFSGTPSLLKRRRFCSRSCMVESRKHKKVPQKCVVCDADFQVSGMVVQSKYCSPKCKEIGRGKRNTPHTFTCEHCSKEFKGRRKDRKYCSRACFGAAYSNAYKNKSSDSDIAIQTAHTVQEALFENVSPESQKRVEELKQAVATTILIEENSLFTLEDVVAWVP